MIQTMANGYSFDGAQQELSNEYQHDRVNPFSDEATFEQSIRTKRSKPCHVGIHWIVLTEYSQMSTHLPGFQSFLRFLHHFVLAKLASSSIRVKNVCIQSRRCFIYLQSLLLGYLIHNLRGMLCLSTIID